TRIGLAGHSLGGMTVLLYTPTDTRVKALVVQSGVSDFNTIKKFKNIEWKQKGYMLFDKSWGGMKVNYSFIEDGMKYDVYAKAKEIKCPVLVIHGDKDESVPLEQSQHLMKFLKREDELVIIKGAPHGYKDKVLEQVTSLLVEFMKKKLVGSK
ncbi:MAG: prolyl oligopeptidase family serine peptidase, partial [Nanoarchaeota archaeon]|nr:prolyl oligopeptidase family serine peptidase [Nanoarchaeota archaeon]